MELHFQFVYKSVQYTENFNVESSVFSFGTNKLYRMSSSIGMWNTFCRKVVLMCIPMPVLMLCLHLFFISLLIDHWLISQEFASIWRKLPEIRFRVPSIRLSNSSSFESFLLKWGHTAGNEKWNERKVKYENFPVGKKKWWKWYFRLKCRCRFSIPILPYKFNICLLSAASRSFILHLELNIITREFQT